jgi:hypothetical protein
MEILFREIAAFYEDLCGRRLRSAGTADSAR